MLHSQSPRLHVKIASPLALQSPRMAGLFAGGAQPRKSGILLRKLCLQIGAAGKAIDQNAEGIALQPGVQVVILRGPVIYTESGAEHRFSVQRGGSPCQ